MDMAYQQVVDALAAELLRLYPRDLLAQPDYGSMTRKVGETSIEVGCWHYAFDDERHHIVFKAERRVFLFLYRCYTSGVVFGTNVEPRLMTPKEAGDYD